MSRCAVGDAACRCDGGAEAAECRGIGRIYGIQIGAVRLRILSKRGDLSQKITDCDTAGLRILNGFNAGGQAGGIKRGCEGDLADRKIKR